MRAPCCLFLKDGSIFPGRAVGFPAPKAVDLVVGKVDRKSAGEVVFNTGMTGYHEILTDPSYTAQIVVLTYPHAGNYGALDEWSEIGPEIGVRREGVKCSALVMRSYYDGPVPNGRITLEAFLKKHRTPTITGVDTRRLTLLLREKGAQNGVIVSTEAELPSEPERQAVQAYLDSFPNMEGRDLTGEVGTEMPAKFGGPAGFHFILIDSGIKMNIVREIVSRGARVTVLSDTTSAQEILSYSPDAVLYSSGPGDPAVLENQISIIQSLLYRLPVFGICLGHQLISLALGAKTYKMKFGHHGVNHPVRDELTGRVFVTTHNHGFAVDEASLPPDVGVWFRDANDGTVEGIYHKTLPVKCAQFHPEACPGPHDSSWIFQSFLDVLKTNAGRTT